MAQIRMEAYSMTAQADKARNLERFLSFMEESAGRGTTLLLFPELSLTGLPATLSMAWPHPESLRYFHENAEPVPEGKSVQALIEKAKALGLYVCWSMTERDADGRFWNTAVMIGPEGFIGKYHKQNLAGTEAFEVEAGRDPCPVFDTPIGKIGLLVCYDKVFPDVVRRMKLAGAEIILSPTAWPGMDRRLGSLDLMMQYHRWSGTNRALENGVILVDANHSSPAGEDRGAEGGHSRIIHPLRGVLAETGWDEAFVGVELDPQAAIAEYYAKLGMTEETHLCRLREAQIRYEKRKRLREIAAVNVRFYARAGSAFASDALTALKARVRTARAKKR